MKFDRQESYLEYQLKLQIEAIKSAKKCSCGMPAEWLSERHRRDGYCDNCFKSWMIPLEAEYKLRYETSISEGATQKNQERLLDLHSQVLRCNTFKKFSATEVDRKLDAEAKEIEALLEIEQKRLSDLLEERRKSDEIIEKARLKRISQIEDLRQSKLIAQADEDAATVNQMAPRRIIHESKFSITDYARELIFLSEITQEQKSVTQVNRRSAWESMLLRSHRRDRCSVEMIALSEYADTRIAGVI